MSDEVNDAVYQQDLPAVEDVDTGSGHWESGLEDRLISTIVHVRLKLDLLRAEDGHRAAVEAESLTRILANLETSLYDKRATDAVLAAA